MKKLLIYAIVALLLPLGMACTKNDNKTVWEEYTAYREANNAWLAEMQARKNADGTPYYPTLVPEWNPSIFVLIHYFNDRAETEGNLSPLSNSWVKANYHLSLYNGTGIDSAAAYQTRLNNTIAGWGVGLTDMRCGDTAEIIIPYAAAYGNQSQGSMLPYSNLRFRVRLVDIPYYEVPPYK